VVEHSTTNPNTERSNLAALHLENSGENMCGSRHSSDSSSEAVVAKPIVNLLCSIFWMGCHIDKVKRPF